MPDLFYSYRRAGGSPSVPPEDEGGGGDVADLGTWPFNNGYFRIDIVKVRKATGPEAGANADGFPNYDPYWVDLRTAGDTSREVVVQITENAAPTILDSSFFPGLQVRYLSRGVYLSEWLDLPAQHTIALTDDGMPALDGVHDLSVDVRLTESIVWSDHGQNTFVGRTLVRGDFFPQCIYLYLDRNRSVEPTVPIMYHDAIYDQYGFTVGGRCAYVNHSDADRNKDFSLSDETVEAWTGDPTEEANLYQEQLQPSTEWAQSIARWFEIPDGNHAGLKYVRFHATKSDENLADLRVIGGHGKFPFTDGPRGKGWMSSYWSGQVTDEGEFYFAEAGGPVRVMRPDGTLKTVAGWRVKTDHDPIYFSHANTAADVHANMELVGTWTEGQYGDSSGFRTPGDCAFFDDDDTVLYVPGFEDHCVWKITITDEDADPIECTISVFAGDPSHTSGYVNATGQTARFSGPVSVACDNLRDVIYVCDQDNDCIRQIDRSTGAVTTLIGSLSTDTYRQLTSVYAHSAITLTGTVQIVSGTRAVTGASTLFTTELKPGAYITVGGESRIVKTISSDTSLVTEDSNDPLGGTPYPVWASNHGPGATATRPNIVTVAEGGPYHQYNVQAGNRAVSDYTVTLTQAGLGVKPDCILPQCVRIDSNGNLVFIDVGLGSIRRYYVATGVCEHLAVVDQSYDSGNANLGNRRGWAWLDVDRWGNAGPLDGIYFGAFQKASVDGETEAHVNEAYGWMPSTGAPASFLYGNSNSDPQSWGTRDHTRPPHYMWGVAVDPRGAVLWAGGGSTGLTRLRKIKAHDPTFADSTERTNYGNGKSVYSQIQLTNVESYKSSSGTQGYYWIPPLLKHGSGCHNLLGFADAWDYLGTSPSDATLDAAFGIDATLCPNDHGNDFLRIFWARWFIRKNIGYQ